MITSNRLRGRSPDMAAHTPEPPMSPERYRAAIQELTNAYELEKGALLRKISELEKLVAKSKKPQPQRLSHLANGSDLLAAVFASKQSEQPGVALPAEFPARAKLVLGGYTTIEDVDGADESELKKAGLNQAEAALVARAVAGATTGV